GVTAQLDDVIGTHVQHSRNFTAIAIGFIGAVQSGATVANAKLKINPERHVLSPLNLVDVFKHAEAVAGILITDPGIDGAATLRNAHNGFRYLKEHILLFGHADQ